MKFLKLRRFVTVVVFIMSIPFVAQAAGDQDTAGAFDWNPVMDAIIQVESGGNAKAVGGNSVGVMQITPVCVRQCNEILKSRGSKLRYTLNDRYDVKKSKEMFVLLQSFYNKGNNVEKAIRSWNGGPHYSVRATQRYYNRVMSHLKG